MRKMETKNTKDLKQPVMQNVIDQQDYFNNARKIVLRECCLSEEELMKCQLDPRSGFYAIIHLGTRGEQNIVGFVPGMRRLYKHIFLSNKQFKQEIVDYYREMGFGWIDVLPVNRVDWKIFIWPKQN